MPGEPVTTRSEREDLEPTPHLDVPDEDKPDREAGVKDITDHRVDYQGEGGRTVRTNADPSWHVYKDGAQIGRFNGEDAKAKAIAFAEKQVRSYGGNIRVCHQARCYWEGGASL